LNLLRHLVDTGDDEPCGDREFIYLRRLALNLINKIKFAKAAPKSKAVKVELYIPAKDIEMMEDIARGPKNCDQGFNDLRLSIARVLNSAQPADETDLHNNALVVAEEAPSKQDSPPNTSVDKGVLANANTFWLIPISMILGTIGLSAMYKH